MAMHTLHDYLGRDLCLSTCSEKQSQQLVSSRSVHVENRNKIDATVTEEATAINLSFWT